MGPDGWLYAAQGSTVTGAVKRFGLSEKPIKSMGQAIWRYHPTTHVYEVFAEGGGNAFGVAFNDNGELFSGHNGGDTRGFHYFQGGYYRKGFNKHGGLSNPHAYGYLNPMSHPPIQRFTHTMLLADGTLFQTKMPRSMIAVDPLHGKLIETQLIPTDSTYKTYDVQDVVACDDKWFRPVAITDGPDGAAYVCDWYDFQVAHLYAHQGKMDREHGRVYRLAPKQLDIPFPKRISGRGNDPSNDWAWNPVEAHGKTLTSLWYLVGRLDHPIRWQRWTASRLISIHPEKIKIKHEVLKSIANRQHALDYLWTAHLCGWLNDTIPSNNDDASSISPFLVHPSPHVRAWALRLICDDGSIAEENLRQLYEYVPGEVANVFDCQIASSAARIPSSQAIPLVFHCAQRHPSDPVVQLLRWWALEKHSDEYDTILQELSSSFNRDSIASADTPLNGPIQTSIPSSWNNLSDLISKLIRRWNSQATEKSLHATEDVLQWIAASPKELQAALVPVVHSSFEKAYEGRSLKAVPDSVINALIRLGEPSLTLRVRKGEKEAIDSQPMSFETPSMHIRSECK